MLQPKITNLEQYDSGLAFTLADKLFFLNQLDFNKIDVFVDFGCANGAVLAKVKEKYPNLTCIGYDCSREQLNLAGQLVSSCEFTDDLRYVVERVGKGKQSAILLSSVLHEIFSYCSSEGIEDFYYFLYHTGFTHIIVRDMMSFPTNNFSIGYKQYSKLINIAGHSGIILKLRQFEQVWGSCDIMQTLLHFLLKVNYDGEDWKRELKENYFGVDANEFFMAMPVDYYINYQLRFLLPYLKESVKKDFGMVNLTQNTHIKLIMSKR